MDRMKLTQVDKRKKAKENNLKVVKSAIYIANPHTNPKGIINEFHYNYTIKNFIIPILVFSIALYSL